MKTSTRHRAVRTSGAAEADILAGEWQLRSAGATLSVSFDGQGGGLFGDIPTRYSTRGNQLVMVAGDAVIEWAIEVHGDQLLVRVKGSAEPLTLRRACRSRPSQRGAVHVEPNPRELCGTWLFCDSFRAYNGGHSSSDVRFTLREDGSYVYGSERSMSAYAYGQGMLTNGSDSDAGHWSVEDGLLVAHSPTRGMQRFRLTKQNHPKSGEPMLCLDGQCFVTATSRPPWGIRP